MRPYRGRCGWFPGRLIIGTGLVPGKVWVEGILVLLTHRRHHSCYTPSMLTAEQVFTLVTGLGRTIEGPISEDCPELGPCLDSTFAQWNGRTRLHIEGRWVFCARIVLAYTLGRPIAPGMLAMHLCNRPICVRPSHLREGTQAENMKYAHKCGRYDSE